MYRHRNQFAMPKIFYYIYGVSYEEKDFIDRPGFYEPLCFRGILQKG